MAKHIKKPYPLFELGEAFDFGKEKGLDIHERMLGRYASSPHDWGILAQMIVLVGGGNHLEIGTLFGGSAILAALVKKEYGISGTIVCIDPLDSWYGNPTDPGSDVKVGVKTVLQNCETFGVLDYIRLVTEKSQPWPLPQEERFSSAFIDGDHTYFGCFSDWLHCKNCVDRAILFHDYCRSNRAVCNCVTSAIRSDSAWLMAYSGGKCAVLARSSWIWSENIKGYGYGRQ